MLPTCHVDTLYQEIQSLTSLKPKSTVVLSKSAAPWLTKMGRILAKNNGTLHFVKKWVFLQNRRLNSLKMASIAIGWEFSAKFVLIVSKALPKEVSKQIRFAAWTVSPLNFVTSVLNHGKMKTHRYNAEVSVVIFTMQSLKTLLGLEFLAFKIKMVNRWKSRHLSNGCVRIVHWQSSISKVANIQHVLFVRHNFVGFAYGSIRIGMVAGYADRHLIIVGMSRL